MTNTQERLDAFAGRPLVDIRASALSDFLDCPARAEAKHLLGLRTPTNGKAALGKALHRSTAVYDESTITGQGLTIDDAATAAVDSLRKPEEETVWEDDDITQREAEGIALSLHGMYCHQIAPSMDYVAVEAECEALEITDLSIRLKGTTDRVRRGPSGGYGIGDLKSGRAAVQADGTVKTQGHAYQMGVYELLAGAATGLDITEPAQIIGLQVGKTIKGQRVAVSHDITGAREVLVGSGDSPGVLEVVARMIHGGVFPGNPRSMMCHQRYCPIYDRCKFRK